MLLFCKKFLLFDEKIVFLSLPQKIQANLHKLSAQKYPPVEIAGGRTVLAAARPLYCIYMVCLDLPGHTGKIRMQYHLLIIIQNPRRYKALPWEHCAEIVVRRKIYSRMRPSTEMVSTCHGINFPLACNAFLAARSSPPQHGTSMRTMVRLLMLFSEKMRVSFSV